MHRNMARLAKMTWWPLNIDKLEIDTVLLYHCSHVTWLPILKNLPLDEQHTMSRKSIRVATMSES